MAFLQGPSRGGDDVGLGSDAGGHGSGWLATTLSALAFLFSGLSFYASALQQADLEVYVPLVHQYGRDAGGEVDVFALPVTIANNGANTGTVLAMELTVEVLKPGSDAKPKKFYSAFIGEHPKISDTPSKTFAPISVPGRATYSETIRFYPQGNPLPKIVDEAGEYRFTLKVMLARPPDPGLIDRLLKPRAPDALTFTRRLPYISEQHLAFRRGTISMFEANWQPTAGAAK